jgi:hypothetical protein
MSQHSNGDPLVSSHHRGPSWLSNGNSLQPVTPLPKFDRTLVACPFFFAPQLFRCLIDFAKKARARFAD